MNISIPICLAGTVSVIKLEIGPHFYNRHRMEDIILHIKQGFFSLHNEAVNSIYLYLVTCELIKFVLISI